MTVLLQLEPLTISQGYDNYEASLGVINSGDENVTSVKIKVVDSSVFEHCKVWISSAYYSCLNVFNYGILRNTTDSNYLFPAGTTKDVQFQIYINDDAPIQQHQIVCYWQYIVY